MADVTSILEAAARGDPSSSEQLLPLVYDELRRLAGRRLAGERPGHTLQPTALVHEAYLRLVDVERAQRWNGRGHFFAAAAEAMRRILVESARRKQRRKRGGGARRVDLEAIDVAADVPPSDDLLALDDALTAFQQVDPAKARLVTLRYFAGLSLDEAAELLGLSRATANRHWAYARAWLYGRVRGGA